jgi:RNA polymerase sigma factor (sigma-70 family)
MSETGWTLLRHVIIGRYEQIRSRLTRSLGSRELAAEVLHETYLRLHRSDAIGVINHPESYIFQIARNIAADMRRNERRRAAQAGSLATILHPDDAPDLAKEMEARSQVNVLKQALSDLSPRRRAILIAARIDGLSHDTIAQRFGTSRTMVQKELRRALEHCVERLGKNSDNDR